MTGLKPEEIKISFMRRRKRQIIGMFVLLISFFILCPQAEKLFNKQINNYNLTVLIIFLIATLSYFVLSIINWRCPSCEVYIRKALNPLYCQSCGVKLRK